jgi:esterase/lipase
MYDSIKTKDKTIKLYEGEYHELLNDYNKDIIIKDIINWINDRT